eukprot:scaffold4660_cov33-Phaeocystis_antarctica.AAC.1
MRAVGDMTSSLLLLLERLHHEPDKRSAPICSTVAYASKAIGRANGSGVLAHPRHSLNITP